jgi:acetyl esterase/lipase
MLSCNVWIKYCTQVLRQSTFSLSDFIFLNYGKPGEDALGVGILKDFQPAFGPESATAEGRQRLGLEISPIYWVSSNLPPTLIIHGDADKLVPIQQAEGFVAKAKEAGVTAKLVVKTGRQHGWPDLTQDLPALADWFDHYLRGLPGQPP